MSKKINGEYGSYKAAVLDDRLKKHCNKKGITQVNFFKDVFKLHRYGWYRGVRSSQWGDKTELKILCDLIGCNFKDLDFKKGEKPTERYLVAPIEPEYIQETLKFDAPKKETQFLYRNKLTGAEFYSDADLLSALPTTYERINNLEENAKKEDLKESMDVVIDRFTTDLNTLLKAMWHR